MYILSDLAAWSPLIPQLERLLGWMSNDAWELSASSDTTQRPTVGDQPLIPADKPEAVALLSGGLDSFSGAVLKGAPALFVSQTDNPTVTSAQRRTWSWLTENGVQGERVQISLSEASRKRENTTRTRALLFYALAVALADARGSDRVRCLRTDSPVSIFLWATTEVARYQPDQPIRGRCILCNAARRCRHRRQADEPVRVAHKG